MVGIRFQFVAVLFSYILSIASSFATTAKVALPSKASNQKSIILTVFPPPDAPRDLNTNVLGLELAFAADSSWNSEFQLVHLSVKNDIQVLAVKTLEAIQKYKPALIVGGSTSNAAFVIGDLAESHQIPFITPWATHPRLTENKKFTFRVCFDDNYQAVKLADFATKEKKVKRVAIFSNRRETFSIGVSEIFAKRFIKNGGAVVGTFSFSDEKELDQKQIEEIVSWKPDLIFIPSYELETAAILSRLVPKLSNKTIYLGADAWGGSRMIQGVLKGLQLNPLAYYVEHWSSDYQSKGNANFLKLFSSVRLDIANGISGAEWMSKNSSAGATISGIALGYDAGLVILEAARIKAKMNQSWSDAIHHVDIEGSTGRFRFKNSPTPEKGLFIYSFEDNSMKFVKAYR